MIFDRKKRNAERKEKMKTESTEEHQKCMVSRRDFLMYTGALASAASVVSLSLFPGTVQAQSVQARIVGYPRQLIAKVSELKLNEPVNFNYPDNGPNSRAIITKMGVKAGGGLGHKQDIVAFSLMCTHQGGPLDGQYKVVGEHRVLGQCPFHLSTFDLRRHGIIVSGQAYESLPQVLLEQDGDEIYAVGIMGLLFGRTDNIIAMQGA
ncbi:arsenate reductase (azurin) small subunit [Moritella viscosa]|uniref:Arsenite oxidase, small subunit n=1 Tax=Moritella viscosa TaxID=80854 RepID=A0A090K7L5_9GAMM|nr:arsenate reductase (azurin) small subunit [Moritella viscosa]CED59803.1 arsenite oxidase, small subunit [Moritella viscosa]SGY92613.1 Arsenite oxidase, small subunit [Moritella viscosa]SGY93224.1 Arsenite oxidase, small subunit [Moritella viscosa]SGZ01185.1 Arsenite oxidase, small subunit [Moritella viscosa]SHO02542.1 Arsenite oxidase, small subunit [Moritella viscosa]